MCHTETSFAKIGENNLHLKHFEFSTHIAKHLIETQNLYLHAF